MPSFSIPLSGLNSDSQALSAIANNLANLNTVGYKATRPLFRDLYYQQVGTTGGGDPIQVGAGTALASNGSVFTQGSKTTPGCPPTSPSRETAFLLCRRMGCSCSLAPAISARVRMARWWRPTARTCWDTPPQMGSSIRISRWGRSPLRAAK